MIPYKKIAVVNAVSNTVRTFLDSKYDTMDETALPLLAVVVKVYILRHLLNYRSRTLGSSHNPINDPSTNHISEFRLF